MAHTHDPHDGSPEAIVIGKSIDDELRQIQDALRGLRFGQVTITVQDGVIVQIDRTERRRFQRKSP